MDRRDRRAGVLVLLLAYGGGRARAAEELPRGDAATQGIDPGALAELVAEAEKSKSDALVIFKDGKLIGQWSFGRPEGPIETMSATKSIVNLAIGRLIDDGKVKSLDEPVHTFFPEWRQGKKKSITLRHLLNHTSGLQAERTTGGEIYPSKNFVQLALAAELSDDPGARFFYNNKAVNLLGGIVKAASGVPIDRYLDEVLFRPLGIVDWSWQHDAAGNPHCMSGLRLRALDLAKIGQLLVDGGVWRGKQIVSRRWIEESTRAGQAMVPRAGLLWWLLHAWTRAIIDDATIAAWRAAKLDEAFIAKVLPMKGKAYERKEFFDALKQIFADSGGLESWYDHTWRRGLPDGGTLVGPVVGYYADGFLGQYLVVLPKERLVAVRQLRQREGDEDEKHYDALQKFPTLVRALVARSDRN